MLELFIGLISGIVSGLGMGGGTVLILFLSFFFKMEQHIAQATNLLFFVPTAVVASFVNWKNGAIDFKIAIPICLWGMLGAGIGAVISKNMQVGLLRKCFGGFLILIAFYQIYEYIKEKKRHTNIK